MARKYTARCACGAVRFEFDKDPDFVAVCHCLDCKKASGGEAAFRCPRCGRNTSCIRGSRGNWNGWAPCRRHDRARVSGDIILA